MHFDMHCQTWRDLIRYGFPRPPNQLSRTIWKYVTIYSCDIPENRNDGTAVALAGMRRGEVIGLNADSAYALATDVFSHRGVTMVQVLKGRSDFATAILVGKEVTIEGIVENVTPEMRALIDAFWPGPLTIMARPNRTLAWAANNEAISVRMPSNEWTRELASELGPMMAVAGSRGSHRAPTTATQAAEIWGSDVPDWLSSGMANPEQTSTVVDFRGSKPNIIRLGALTASNLRQVVPSITMIAN